MRPLLLTPQCNQILFRLEPQSLVSATGPPHVTLLTSLPTSPSTNHPEPHFCSRWGCSVSRHRKQPHPPISGPPPLLLLPPQMLFHHPGLCSRVPHLLCCPCVTYRLPRCSPSPLGFLPSTYLSLISVFSVLIWNLPCPRTDAL